MGLLLSSKTKCLDLSRTNCKLEGVWIKKTLYDIVPLIQSSSSPPHTNMNAICAPPPKKNPNRRYGIATTIHGFVPGKQKGKGTNLSKRARSKRFHFLSLCNWGAAGAASGPIDFSELQRVLTLLNDCTVSLELGPAPLIFNSYLIFKMLC
uniref:Uncharacterized protein n=1 Tax=Sphaerodactylus townsendi TaxID=933632 RepID=A0ACB8F1K3_9SAUR